MGDHVERWTTAIQTSGRRGTAMGFLIVFLGGRLGAARRHGVNLAFARLTCRALCCGVGGALGGWAVRWSSAGAEFLLKGAASQFHPSRIRVESCPLHVTRLGRASHDD